MFVLHRQICQSRCTPSDHVGHPSEPTAMQRQQSVAVDAEEPVMILPDFWLGTAEKTTWVDDVAESLQFAPRQSESDSAAGTHAPRSKSPKVRSAVARRRCNVPPDKGRRG